jgi:hypothetical protein
MEEIIEQLQATLQKAFNRIENRLMAEQIDVAEIDSAIDNMGIDDSDDFRKNMLAYRETVIKYKMDRSFWDKDVPSLISLLDTSSETLKSHITKNTREIGGKDLPSEEIISLIQRGILSTNMTISKTYKGKEFIGNLTNDGFLELKVNGVIVKRSLRRAALFAWGCSPQNQWEFWETMDSNGKRRPLEYFRTL